jgi:hypothetical protein
METNTDLLSYYKMYTLIVFKPIIEQYVFARPIILYLLHISYYRTLYYPGKIYYIVSTAYILLFFLNY